MVASEWFDEVHDVVVIGSGAAGSASALSAHQAGADVVVLEKCDAGTAGGNTRVSGGGWAMIRDEVGGARFLRALCGGFPLPDDVVETWAREMVRNNEWMLGLGADARQTPFAHVQPEYLDHEGSDCYLGMNTVGGGLGNFALHDFLTKALFERDVPTHFSSTAVELIRSSSGSVAGVRVENADGERRYEARGGVVLATGGFQANPQMVRDYLRLPEAVLWGSPASTGDGHRMAQALGADLWHMDNMMTLPGLEMEGRGMFLTLHASHHYLFVKPNGRRFRDESVPGRHGQTVDGNGPELAPLHPFFLVFDERMRTATPLGAGPEMLAVGWGLMMEGLRWSVDNTAEIQDGRIHRADSIEGLATSLDMEPDVLSGTVAAYNRACELGHDEVFGRRPATLGSVVEGPFYAVEVVPMLAWSNGGPRRDGRARVVDVWGNPIPGLYAAGEVSSTYSWAKDGGFHIGDALAFGRVAGYEAAVRTFE